MRELDRTEFHRTRALFDGISYSLSLHAALDGSSPGRFFVDDEIKPRTAFALTVEGYFLAGDFRSKSTKNALSALFRNSIFSGDIYINGNESMSLAVHPSSWERILPELIPTHELEKIDRYQYLCDKVICDWRGNLPTGYSVRRLTQDLMDGSQTIFSKDLIDWFNIPEMWGTHEFFFAQGISYIIMHDQEVVAWCTPDCAAGDQLDVGVFVHPSHRNLGLATIVVAATVEDALSDRFRKVGWHCNKDNIGSWKTAEKVGFKRNDQYTYYYYMYDPIDHLAELGWHYYRKGEYEKTVSYYQEVFSRRDQNPDYYFHLAGSACALIGNTEEAILYLQLAAQNGWSNVQWTMTQEEFQILHDSPAWNQIIARMNANSGA